MQIAGIKILQHLFDKACCRKVILLAAEKLIKTTFAVGIFKQVHPPFYL